MCAAKSLPDAASQSRIGIVLGRRHDLGVDLIAVARDLRAKRRLFRTQLKR